MARLHSISAIALIMTGLLLDTRPAFAAEISTNGTGGGPWSDAATWQNKKVPGPDDLVIIRKFDAVEFDRNDDGKVSCNKLQIDPKGIFLFKTGAGKLTFCVTDAIESYGIIKLDGTRSANDFLELRMLGDKADKRKIKLGKGAALLLYGRANLPEGKRNVALTSPKPANQKDSILGLVEGDDGVISIDWQRADIQDVKLAVKKIDNTGAKQYERLNLIENQFSGLGRVWCYSCDTPVIAKNTFDYKGGKGARIPGTEGAITLSYCPLSDIRGNVIRGFYVGIWLTYQTDAVVIGNTVENSTHGISGSFGATNTMIKQCQVRNCDTGIVLQGATGVVEDTVIEGGNTAFINQNSSLQMTNLQVKGLGPKAVAMKHEGGTLSLLNCNILPPQIVMGPPPAKPEPEPPVTCLQYLVVGAKNAQANCRVDVRTTVPALPADAADPNVRNSPAPLTNGLSPLPRTINPLIVKAWCLDDKGKVIPAPEYTIKILGPPPKEGADRPVLHTMTYRPQENALRSSPSDATPTVVVPAK